MALLDNYIPIVGSSVVNDLKLLAERLRGKKIQNINSTAVGGGVAEILTRMVPLLRELGVDASWDVIKGGEQFFVVTKKFHNVLHGRLESIEQHDFDIFNETSQKNIDELDTYGDIVFVHDPQPIELIQKRRGNKWMWRCHIDVSAPDPRVWSFLEQYVTHYDAAVFSAPNFSRPLPAVPNRNPVRQYLIAPSIDPLSDKNKELPQEVIDSVLRKFNIANDKPIITQISRFDYLKDPVGVIEVYHQVKKYTDCQLVLAGGTATDDPESAKVLEEVQEKSGKDPDIHILLIPPGSDIEINALQRASAVIMQKSIKEGFGLTVSEALWKAKPVVASAVGGITLQIKHRYSGLLCRSVDGASFAVKQMLNTPSFAKQLGQNGREHIRQNFLLTRHLREYMLAFLSLFYDGDIVNL